MAKTMTTAPRGIPTSNTNSPTATTHDSAIIEVGGDAKPSNALRNASIAPAIGLSPNNVLHVPCTVPIGYAIGVARSQSWTRRGTTYRTSRYLTFSAASQAPVPIAAVSASPTNGSAITMRQVG